MKNKNYYIPMAIGNLAWKETFSGWGFLVLAIAACVLVLGAPMLVASKEDASLIPSARTQVACFFSWVIPMFWGLLRISSIGASQRLRNLSLFWKCMGASDAVRFAFILLPYVFISLLCTGFASIIYFVSYSGGSQPPYEAGLAAMQFLILGTVIQVGFLGVALGLSSIISAAGAFFATCALSLYCLYGITLLGFIRGSALTGAWKIVFVDVAWSFSPQVRLGDLTTRLVFNWGAMPSADFGAILAYCGFWSLTFLAFGYAAFKRGPISATA